MDLNNVEIGGGLTREPNFHFTQSGMPVLEMTVALNGTRFDPQRKEQVVTTTYVSVQAFGWLAEQTANLGLQPGDTVYVKGRLDQREVEKSDGKVERKTRVTAGIITPTKMRMNGGPPTQRRADVAPDPWAPSAPSASSGPGWSQQ